MDAPGFMIMVHWLHFLDYIREFKKDVTFQNVQHHCILFHFAFL
uniref:Uncharacterized protein n=1 Tax=Rhizophora mucronata TaxID=61149 RepID=A0A2P2Q5H5_RHIMU